MYNNKFRFYSLGQFKLVNSGPVLASPYQPNAQSIVELLSTGLISFSRYIFLSFYSLVYRVD